MHGAVEIGRALRNGHAGRRTDRLYEGLGRLGAVLIDHVHPQIADHGVAEGRGENGKGNQRNADDEQQRHLVAPDPRHLARGDVDNAETAPVRHQRPPAQSA